MFHLFETRSAVLGAFPSLVGEKLLVGFIVLFDQLLQRLTTHQLPVLEAGYFTSQSGDMLLHLISAGILTRQAVVAALQGNQMVPDETGYVNLVVQPSVAPVLAEPVFECLPDGYGRHSSCLQEKQSFLFYRPYSSRTTAPRNSSPP